MMPKTRILLCDVQGIASLSKKEADLKLALSAIAQAFYASLRYSQHKNLPIPQQGFGDAVWWVAIAEKFTWSDVIESYAVFAAHLLGNSINLPFVLIAPSVAGEGIGIVTDLPWTYGIEGERVRALASEGVPVNWLYSTEMHGIWTISESGDWRPVSTQPAPMLVCLDKSLDRIQEEIFNGFYARPNDVIITPGTWEISEKKIRAFRVDNSLDSVISLGIKMGTLDRSLIEGLREVSADFGNSREGKAADIQTNISKTLESWLQNL